MNQQINLYQPMFRREKKVFSATAMAQVAVIVLVGLLGIYAFAFWQSRSVEIDLRRLETERDGLRQKVVDLALEYPVRQRSKALENQIAELKMEIERHRQIQQVLENETGVSGGFGDYFEALARQHVKGTWLRGISIDGGGGRIGITGSAVQPDLVTTYIQQLAAEPVFSGVTFNVLNLEFAQSEFEDRVDFVLRTHAAVIDP